MIESCSGDCLFDDCVASELLSSTRDSLIFSARDEELFLIADSLSKDSTAERFDDLADPCSVSLVRDELLFLGESSDFGDED